MTTNVSTVGFAALLGGMGGGWTVNSRTISQLLVSSDTMGRYSAAARLERPIRLGSDDPWR